MSVLGDELRRRARLLEQAAALADEAYLPLPGELVSEVEVVDVTTLTLPVPGTSGRRQRWTPDAIKARLLELQREGEPIGNNHVKKMHCSLFQASKRIFGSYRAAVEAAGIDYSSVAAPLGRPGADLTPEERREKKRLANKRSLANRRALTETAAVETPAQPAEPSRIFRHGPTESRAGQPPKKPSMFSTMEECGSGYYDHDRGAPLGGEVKL